ncbi:hypothetical protein AB0E81_12950 [Streptomyces sp. NPDC033538]|uniref:hypothetical protein n=1 Tax=Streptomyces sp. NPDC033538 TaxID=3155367 RepID=UPI0033EE6A35
MTAPALPVPYIAAWSGEQTAQRQITCRADGIAYADEQRYDRDQHGVLWNGRAYARGTGRPRFGEVHPTRQRDAMAHLLCQVCGAPADRDARGTLWLLEDARADWSGWPDGLMTTHPPVCLPCARLAADLCPHLRGRYVAVRVRESDACAVLGRLWAPTALGTPRRLEKGVVSYGTSAARWVTAGQLIRSLHSCTFVDLDDAR